MEIHMTPQPETEILEEDGGYYALKGFAYQFDKSILTILENPTESICIEQEQDINYQDYYVQVKYYETDYIPSQRKQKIKSVVVKMLNEFQEDPAKTFCLYVFFKNEIPRKSSLTPSDLDNLLGKNKIDFTTEIKNNFTKTFIIVFAVDFLTQFKLVINKVMALYSVPEPIACIYHSIFINHILSKVVQNAGENRGNRFCSKYELDTIVHQTKKVIFYACYSEHLGKTRYHRMLRKTYFTSLNIEPYARIFIIEVPSNVNKIELKEIILFLKRKWSKNTKRTTHAYAPYIFLRNCDYLLLCTIKSELLNEGYVFRDGHDFQGAPFNTRTLIEQPNPENKICLKFINCDSYMPIILSSITRTKEIYEFYSTVPLEMDFDLKYIKIHVDNISEITSIV
ncbi:MAG TPA: hypothetical protein GXZ27_04435 [Thermoanaerobacterales bacterium]|nr:hypothetical protein [Thermoanaerobacterales bacterium]